MKKLFLLMLVLICVGCYSQITFKCITCKDQSYTIDYDPKDTIPVWILVTDLTPSGDPGFNPDGKDILYAIVIEGYQIVYANHKDRNRYLNYRKKPLEKRYLVWNVKNK